MSASDVRAAEIGERLRAIRRRRGMSLHVLAGLAGLSAAYLSMVENGKRKLDRYSRIVALADALGVPPGELAPGMTAVPGARPSVGVPGSASRPTAVLALAQAGTEEPAKHAVLSGFDGFDGSIADYLSEQLRRSKGDDGAFGPARALPVVLGVIEAIAKHVPGARPDVRKRLLTVGADGAEFAGWLYRDLEDTTSATYWYDRAMEWAQAANDTAMQGYVLLKKSQMAYDRRDACRVAMFAEAAQHGPWQLPAAIRAEVTQQEVVGMAMLGEPLSAIERQTDEARRWLMQAAGEPCGAVNAYFTMETLSLRTAACYTEAGKPKRAAELFEEILSTGTLSRRDFGFFNARRATALALSGEPDEAAAVGLASFQVAQETHSERTVRVLGDVVRNLEPWSARPGPRALKEAVLA